MLSDDPLLAHSYSHFFTTAMTQYDPHRWTDHLFDIRGSMVREILGRVSLCVIWAVLITLVYQLGGDAMHQIAIPETCHTLVGGALALLLVFRTNSSYDRFWEGRKLWGGIVNETRNLVRTASAFLSEDPETLREIVLWTMAFPWTAMARLRGKLLQETFPPAFAEELPSDVVQRVATAKHVPLAVAMRITELLERARSRGQIDSYRLGLIDLNTQQLMDYLGGCERIRSTPLPYAYTVHLRRALIFYCFTLPFALEPRFGWSTIPAVLLTCYIFFGIEEIGVEIEDPFGEDENDLPLERICQSIEQPLRAAMPPSSSTGSVCGT
jgi:ion channel-forming bestrophin family protein